MDRISTADQTKLHASAQKVATYSAGGLSPTEALFKVASEDKLTPIMIQRAAEAFNKSKSVDHFIKTAAGDDRAKPFPLADPGAVITQVYTPQQKVAHQTALPKGDFTTVNMDPVKAIEKVASAAESIQVTKLLKHSADNMIEKHASLCTRFSMQLDEKLGITKLAFNRAIEKACEEIQTVPENELHKIAQLVTNGYHKDSDKLASKMLAVIGKMTRREFPTVEKTANAAVFPNRQPYIALNHVKEAAFAYDADLKARTILQKEADIGKQLYEEYIKSRQIGGPEQQSTDVLMDIVDPEIINNLNKQKARTRLMELMLHDEDIKNYDVDSVLKAYQNTVGSVPKAVERPTVLKNLMLKNIESGGRKDIFELGQEAKLDKDIQAKPGVFGDEMI